MLKHLKKNKPALGLLLILSSACSTGPRITVCIVDANGNALQCTPPEGASFSKPISESENYVCLSPSDTQTLFTYVKQRCVK